MIRTYLFQHRSTHATYLAVIGLMFNCLTGCNSDDQMQTDASNLRDFQQRSPGELNQTLQGATLKRLVAYVQEKSPAEKSAAVETPKKQELEPLDFDNWKNPELVFVFSGRQHGYIEPCGCTGLANQKGGLLRRHGLIQQLEGRGWSLVKVDAGNQIRRFGEQPKIKLNTTIRALSKVMQYDAIAMGPDDLRLPGIALFDAIENNSPASGHPFTSANIGIFGDYTFLSPFRVVEHNGKKIGIMAVLGDEHPETINNAEIEFKKAEAAIGEVWPKLKEQKCDLNILIAQTSLENSEAWAKKFPHFDLLITTGGAGEPTLKPVAIKQGDHTTQMIQVGTKGMYVGVVGLFAEGEKLRYQRVPLDARFEDTEEMKRVFIDYQNQLKVIGLEGLGLKPALHPSGAKFVGTETCKDCHEYAYDVWKKGIKELGDDFGPHSHATTSLVEPNERVWVTRYHDPECLSCHATGWNPQKYFPYIGGFGETEIKKLDDKLELGKSLALFGNGCENCHGPGSQHVAAENGDIDVTPERMKELQQSMVLTLESAKADKCMECHDLDNSPDFHTEGAFEKYWKRIVHNEKE
jgi:hypothetical protein